MSFCLFRLRFSTPVHIGKSESARSLETIVMSFCADALFSGLCHVAAERGGAAGVRRLFDMAASGDVALSDAMPYKNERLYLPKPCLRAAPRYDLAPEDRKRFKHLRYIPLDMFNPYIGSLSTGPVFPSGDADNDFGIEHITEKVGLLGFDKSEPYSIGLFTFHESCGLYVLVKYEKDAELAYIRQLMTLLSYRGIGGKLSSGYGKFTLDDTVDAGQRALLSERLNAPGMAMTLAAALPKDGELNAAMDNCSYTLLRRGGFILSEAYKHPVKKRTQYFFAAGSVFQYRFEGDIYDVAPGGPHPVYRYGKPLFVGVGI